MEKGNDNPDHQQNPKRLGQDPFASYPPHKPIASNAECGDRRHRRTAKKAKNAEINRPDHERHRDNIYQSQEKQIPVSNLGRDGQC